MTAEVSAMTKATEQGPIDMAVVGRIARRVNLEDVFLVELSSERKGAPHGALRIDVTHSHKANVWGPNRIEVSSTLKFQAVNEVGELVFVGGATLHLSYALQAGDPLTAVEADQFAAANGAFNSWPFFRALLHGLSAQMGVAPFTLPSLIFRPPVPSTAQGRHESTEG